MLEWYVYKLLITTMSSDKKPSFSPRRSFWDGLASVFNVSGRYARNLDYLDSKTETKSSYYKSDKEAIRSDWATIGLDIRQAARQYNKDKSNKKQSQTSPEN